MTEAPESRVVPEYVPLAQAFQRVFGKYFPHLLDDLDAAAFEMEWIETRVMVAKHRT